MNLHEPPVDFGPIDDRRPIVVWIIVFVVLVGVSWLGLECLFGFCVLQDDWWPAHAAGISTLAMFVSVGVFGLFDKFTGRERED